MPDVSPVPDEVAAALRAANARLRQVVEAKDTEVGVLRGQAEALRAEVAELRARLAQNSKNTSKPPSSDGLAKPAPKSLRRKTGRRPGRPKGQPGVSMTGAEAFCAIRSYLSTAAKHGIGMLDAPHPRSIRISLGTRNAITTGQATYPVTFISGLPGLCRWRHFACREWPG